MIVRIFSCPFLAVVTPYPYRHFFQDCLNLKFEDITEKARVGGEKSWSTGVSLVDINADGFLDIYVSNSGDIKGDNKQNELFINNGDLTFTEMAKEYGLDDKGYSTHAAFFDFDRERDNPCLNTLAALPIHLHFCHCPGGFHVFHTPCVPCTNNLNRITRASHAKHAIKKIFFEPA